jgi:hypothetical protein
MFIEKYKEFRENDLTISISPIQWIGHIFNSNLLLGTNIKYYVTTYLFNY